ncbi:MAG: Acetyltransferase family [Solirubrobacteraceae bacterium]|jgi:ribosomal protein S18 acetylase RimI-like enzyme|nr:Acetyltransferase family [Solirubrobacteraceae bacterium]
MPPVVRPAEPTDAEVPRLLYLSAAPYYDAYAGSERRALKVLQAIWGRPGHTAAAEQTLVAELDGMLAGAMVAFPSADGDRLARRFLALSIVRLPVWRWPAIARHLRASAGVTPTPPRGALYVDALATAEPVRRRGVATALLDAASARARAEGLTGVALDTGLQNVEAQALYERYGFEPGDIHRAPDERTARAVGGAGFVSYFLAV